MNKFMAKKEEAAKSEPMPEALPDVAPEAPPAAPSDGLNYCPNCGCDLSQYGGGAAAAPSHDDLRNAAMAEDASYG
jgi:hypothetical protein